MMRTLVVNIAVAYFVISVADLGATHAIPQGADDVQGK